MDKTGKGEKSCPTLTQRKVLTRANNEYEDSNIYEFARQASLQESECYANRHEKPYVMQPTKTRIIEIIEFCKKMNCRRLGLAFCIGLSKEAKIVQQIFEEHGFETISVCCKAGRTSKDTIGLSDEEKIYRGTDESMCNPIFQAELLNNEQVDISILIGLCVGHDSLFFKYSTSPVTVLAVKDRVTGHNPLAAVYNSDSYYRKMRHPDLT
jgi:uncharacterized metal-binding protein